MTICLCHGGGICESSVAVAHGHHLCNHGQSTPPPPCVSYALVQATVGVGTVLIWDFGVAYTKGGGGIRKSWCHLLDRWSLGEGFLAVGVNRFLATPEGPPSRCVAPPFLFLWWWGWAVAASYITCRGLQLR